jgi:hypothetical protein
VRDIDGVIVSKGCDLILLVGLALEANRKRGGGVKIEQMLDLVIGDMSI